MKKLFVFALLCLSVRQLKAQDVVVFKMKYQPARQYKAVAALGMNVNLNMAGNKKILDSLKAKGITMPLAVKLNIDLNGDITTGTPKTDNSFPLTIEYNLKDLSVDLAGKKMEPFAGKNFGIKIFAHSKPDGSIDADSTFINNKKDTAQAMMSNMLKSLQNQIKFPERALKVGDTFTQQAPANLPTAGKMKITATKTIVSTTYKLTAIADGKAYFDITQKADVEISIKTANVVLTGSGTGKLVYSIKDNFPLTLNDKVSIKLNVTVDKMIVDGTADIIINGTNTVD